jgi:fatty acid desaturase
MTAMAAPKTPAPEFLSDADRKVQKRRYMTMLVVTTACCFAALGGVVGHVSLHQWWGLPLFFLALAGGFGAQIAFIVGLVRASRPDKGV